MSLSDATLRTAIAKILMEELAKADRETRAEGLREFLAANADLGLRSAEIKLPNGVRVGTATLPDPKAKPVVDQKALLEYVKTEYPSEIVQSVNPVFKSQLEKQLEIVDGEVINVVSGEAVPWASPGDTPEPKSYSIVFNSAGRDAIKEAWLENPEILLEFLAPDARPITAPTPPVVTAPAVEDDDMDLGALLSLRAHRASAGVSGDAA